jgi:hypothetical protein
VSEPSIAASTVDEAGTELLLNALSPNEIALALAAADEVADRHRRIGGAAELAVERARYEADRAQRAFHAVEPDNRLVARSLETRDGSDVAEAVPHGDGTSGIVADGARIRGGHGELCVALSPPAGERRRWPAPAQAVPHHPSMGSRVLGVSERFACRVAGQHRATQRHQPVSATPDDPDSALRAWLRQYAKEHSRGGFRPAYHDARGEGWVVNHKKAQRLWREEGLRVRSGGVANGTEPRQRKPR